MSEPPFNPSSLAVLVVDDHDPMRKSIRRVLESKAFGEIIESSGGTEAIKILNKKAVDLIICDLYMRKGSGFSLLEFIRNRDICSDIPFLVVTGEASKEEIVKVANLGAEDYLLKPFHTTDLEKKVIRLITNHLSPTPILRAQRLGEKKYIEGKFIEACESFKLALSYDNQSQRSLHGLALCFYKINRYDEAIQLLETSIQINNSYYRNYAALADIYLKKNQLDSAIEAMSKELQINPKQASRQTQLGVLLLKAGNPTGAVEHFRTALQENPKLISALMGMGQAFAVLKNVDKSLYYYKRVRRYHPRSTKALEAAVKVAVAANELRKAEIFLKDEKNARPEVSDTYFILALFFIRFDREDEALQLAQSMLEKDPEQPQALKIMAKVYLKKQEPDTAVKYLETLSKIAPSAEVFLQIGEIFLRGKKISQATQALIKALGMQPNSPEILFALAEAHKISHQWLKALILYEKAYLNGFTKKPLENPRKLCFSKSQKRRQQPKLAS
jgi:two-component system chemotaxis response regulator CheY